MRQKSIDLVNSPHLDHPSGVLNKNEKLSHLHMVTLMHLHNMLNMLILDIPLPHHLRNPAEFDNSADIDLRPPRLLLIGHFSSSRRHTTLQLRSNLYYIPCHGGDRDVEINLWKTRQATAGISCGSSLLTNHSQYSPSQSIERGAKQGRAPEPEALSTVVN